MATEAFKVPSPVDATAAREAARALGRLTDRQAATLRVRPDDATQDVSVTVPRVAFDLFLEILGQIANGNAVTIVPVHAELTTQEAADLLNVSRPHFVALLESGKLPFRLVGTHRRVKMADLMAYKTKVDAESARVLDELAAEAQKHGLGY